MKLFEVFWRGGLEFASEVERDKASGAEEGGYREDGLSVVLLMVQVFWLRGAFEKEYVRRCR
jgi:hypothetical protein